MLILSFLLRLLCSSQSAKVLKYIGFHVTCDIFFVLFLISWTITRQILLPLVILSIIFEGPRLTPYIPWSQLGQDGIYWSKETRVIFISLLIGLQILLCVWFVMIIRVAWKVIKGYEAEDTRSDVETSSEDESEEDDAKGRGVGKRKEESERIER